MATALALDDQAAKYLNAGAIMGTRRALIQMYHDIMNHMVLANPTETDALNFMLRTGNWVMHAYDQMEYWRYAFRSMVEATEGGTSHECRTFFE